MSGNELGLDTGKERAAAIQVLEGVNPGKEGAAAVCHYAKADASPNFCKKQGTDKLVLPQKKVMSLGKFGGQSWLMALFSLNSKISQSRPQNPFLTHMHEPFCITRHRLQGRAGRAKSIPDHSPLPQITHMA
eukprot:1047383-Pelagomonas_calceolata.AAC.1